MVYMMCVYEVHVNNRISDRWGEISTSGGEIRTVEGELVHISHKTVKQYMHDRHCSGVTTGPADPASGGAAPLGGGILKIC